MKIQNLLTDLTGSFKLPNVYTDKKPKNKVIKLNKNKYGTNAPASLFVGTGNDSGAGDASGGDGGGGGE